MSKIHGEASNGKQTKEYFAWARTKAKCTVPTHHRYKIYGGRGIKMCDRWMNSYQNFLDDMGRAPSPKHSLGRIDNDGNYEPSNCRWETQMQQCNNLRKSVRVEHEGQIKTVSEWASFFGLRYSFVYHRVKRGMSIKDIILLI